MHTHTRGYEGPLVMNWGGKERKSSLGGDVACVVDTAKEDQAWNIKDAAMVHMVRRCGVWKCQKKKNNNLHETKKQPPLS